MNEILKNGKELKEALIELREYVEPSKDKLGNKYYAIEEYFAKMDSVFGVGGYEVSYSELTHMVLPSGQVVLTSKCHIAILAQEGVAFSVEGYGSYEVPYSTETGKCINLNTAGVSCTVNAFKSACREMSIFGCRDVEVKGKNKSNKNTNASTSSAAVKTRQFFLQKPLQEMWKDREGKPAYRMVAREIVGEQMIAGESEILFYPNQYKKNVAKFNDLVMRSNDTKGFKIIIGVTDVAADKSNSEYSGSYIFKRFGEGA